MRTRTLPNGNLLITAGNLDRQSIADAYRSGGYQRAESEVLECLRSENFEMLAPENIGALTEAPILCNDAHYPDDGNGFVPYDDNSPVWWFPDYCIRDPWRELASKGRVVFQAAPKDSADV